jgi:MFS transporter, OPA family, sugar phosphate sensor protein UhpC
MPQLYDPPQRVLAPPPASAGAPAPLEVARLYRFWRWSGFLSITFGYAFFYTTRLSFSVVKKPLLDSGLLDAVQMGTIGFTLLVGYAVGKLANGLIADRVSPPRFFATGLLLAAATNVLFGASSSYPVFVALWAVNGWLQSLGGPASGVVMAQWFADHERGTRYAIWSTSHNMGEAFSFAVTTLLVIAFGWRWGFLGPGLISATLALVLYHTVPPRTHELGLPPINELRAAPGGVSPVDASSHRPLLQLQLDVLRNPRVWILATSSAMMYIPRYAINNWGVLYLQIDRSYSLGEAGFVASIFPLVGIAGTLLSGLVSDRFFDARRSPVTLVYGLLFVGGLAALFFAPPGHPWIVRLSMATAGFAIGGLLVFLGGLTAMDISSKRAAGTALGLVGSVSYAGAAAQDLISGRMIERSRRVVAGVTLYDFGKVKLVWLAAACMSVVLPLTIWRAERRRRAISAP